MSNLTGMKDGKLTGKPPEDLQQLRLSVSKTVCILVGERAKPLTRQQVLRRLRTIDDKVFIELREYYVDDFWLKAYEVLYQMQIKNIFGSFFG